MAGQDLTITLESATTISGLWLGSAEAQACLVLAHGAGAGMAHRSMAALADGLLARGIASLRFQFPGMERGSRRPDAPAVAHAAVRAAFAEARRRAGGLPLFAGGRSFGGRMTSQAEALAPLEGARGLVFFAFPLHPAGKPADTRAEHLLAIRIPMLVVQGSRDALAEMTMLRPVLDRLGDRAELALAVEADHAFHVPSGTGRHDPEVLGDLLDRTAAWIIALAKP